MLPWLSSLWLVLQKITQFGVFVFTKAQEINLWGNLQGSKCDGDCIFFENFFRFAKNFLPLLILWGFFEIFLPQLPVMFSTDLH